ncbi:glycosyltransferase [Butyrivibrio sp.]|uniref:glycosyltransferase family protein n=1 Tax=Butyrivibrio sp. TaxID=28121 RepID=UPI0025BCA053|nr:glycosyltransferase [Butyrivibrio sp.]MBQ9301607.1 glycosyltransferase [Butyrivibrio sp.]
MNMIFYRYNSVCEPDYIDAFKGMGINVIEDRDGMDNSVELSSKIHKIGELVLEYSPLFIFSINYFPFISIVCDKLGVIYMAETVDCPVFEIYHNSIRNKNNRLFLFDYAQYSSIKDYNSEGTFYLPLGSPVERVSKLLGNENRYLYDISFIGSLYAEKDPFIDLNISDDQKKNLTDLMEKQIHDSPYGIDYISSNFRSEDVKDVHFNEPLFDNGETVLDLDKSVFINNYLTYHMAYLERTKILNSLASEMGDGVVHLFTRSSTDRIDPRIVKHNGVKTLTEMPFVFRQSKININTTMRSIQTGIPQRVWDILSCRGFVLTNYQPEIEEYFEIGKHIETYENEEELREKVKYYLEHDEEREKIARLGFEEVRQKHTIIMRTISMIKAVTSFIG